MIDTIKKTVDYYTVHNRMKIKCTMSKKKNKIAQNYFVQPYLQVKKNKHKLNYSQDIKA